LWPLPLFVTVNFDPPRAAAFGGFGGAPDEETQRKEVEEAEKNPAELQKAGVSFALVSGHATNFLAGIRKAVEKGLPREAALKAVTLTAAELLGIADAAVVMCASHHRETPALALAQCQEPFPASLPVGCAKVVVGVVVVMVQASLQLVGCGVG